MPQLDKVTLFSQVFWLIFFYFLFFLLFLKYYLPKLSKLFKIRLYYMFRDRTISVSYNNSIGFQSLVKILSMFSFLLRDSLVRIREQYNVVVKSYNSLFFKRVNSRFVVVYVLNCLKLNLYRKLYV